MDKKIFSNEMKLISFCTRLQMDATTQLQIESLLGQPISWQTIIEQSLYHGVLPLLYYNIVKLNKLNLPENILSILKNSYYITLSRNIVLWKEFCYLQDVFHRAGTKIIPLKGIILGKTLYHDIGLRPMVDIDILIQEEDLRHAEKHILQLGYQKQLKNLPENYWRMYQPHFSFYNSKKEITLELHWQLAPPRPKTLDLTDVWERAKIQIVDQARILSLSFEDTLLSLWLHIGKNISSLQHLRLRNLCDIHELITQHNNNLDWDYLTKKIEFWRIKGLLSYLHYLTKRYLNTPWPLKIVKKLRFPFMQRKLLISWAPNLKPLSRPQAALLMISMLDKLKDCLALVLIGILMVYRKNKLLILHSKT